MNSTTSSGGFLVSQNIGGFLLLITTITLASYFCNRVQTTLPGSALERTITREPPHPHHIVLKIGLQEETLSSYPKLLYSEAKLSKDSTATWCSICLGDYKGSDMLKLLPDCGHLFHLKCVDPWLQLQPRVSSLQDVSAAPRLSTPLAEVVPPATRRDTG